MFISKENDFIPNFLLNTFQYFGIKRYVSFCFVVFFPQHMQNVFDSDDISKNGHNYGSKVQFQYTVNQTLHL